MIVDDEDFIHQLYNDILEMHGYKVIASAFDGDDAVDMFLAMEDRPDIIIMDHRMPRKDGVDAMVDIRLVDRKTRIIFASADGTVRDKAMGAGADGFLLKPFKISELLGSLDPDADR
ncbi:MAG: response regulator [Candidatus Thermoplasmatota archaeon]|nr:response regulator [Candidatus Thermoplasmatota archaeon]